MVEIESVLIGRVRNDSKVRRMVCDKKSNTSSVDGSVTETARVLYRPPCAMSIRKRERLEKWERSTGS